MPSFVRRTVKVVFYFAITLILIFVALEICFNLYITFFASEENFERYASITQLARAFNNYGEHFRVKPHPYTGYIPTPGYNSGCNKHNKYGFRGEEIGDKQDGEIWIACVGESTTYDYEIPCWDKTYPNQLEHYLKERGINVKVINAGVDGWTSFEILIDFESRVCKFPIDVVIYYGGFNDVIFNRMVYPIPENLYERDILVARGGIDKMLNFPFWQWSALFRFVSIKRGFFVPHFDLFSVHSTKENRFYEFVYQLSTQTYPAGIFKEIPTEKILELNPPIWFENNIKNLISLSQARNITPVLVTYAMNKSGQNDSFIITSSKERAVLKSILLAGVEEMNQALIKLSNELSVPLLELSPFFSNDPGLFVDLIHNNEKGAEKKAEMIGKFLIQQEIVR